MTQMLSQTLAAALLCVIGLLGPAIPQALVQPQIGIQNSGACRQLAVKNPAGTAQVPMGCVDTGTGAFRSTPDALTVGQTNGFTLPYARSVSGAATRSVLAKLGDLPLTPQDLNVNACTGIVDDTATLGSLLANQSDITIPSGVCRVAANTTWPKNKVVRIAPGGGITVDGGKVLTIRSRIEAPLQQVFFGTGQVVGLKENRPEWWGAQNTFGYASGRNDAPAFNAALNSARFAWAGDGTPTDGDRPGVRFNGNYYACSQIDAYPSQTVNLGFYGSGSLNGGGTITACPTFTGAALFNVHGVANSAGYTGFDIDFRDFALSCSGSNAPMGMSWVPEGAGYSLIGGLQASSVANVAVTACPTGIKYQNTRLVKFDRVSVWGPNTTVGLWVTSSDNQSFTGDTEFIDFGAALCGNSTSNSLCAGITSIKISADGSVGAGAQQSDRIKGLRFKVNLANAEKAVDIQSLNGAGVGDIWLLPGTQIDGFACNTIHLKASGTVGGYIDSFQMTNTYNRGRNVGCPFVDAAATGNAKIRTLNISGNMFLNPTDGVANFFNVQGLQFNNNTVYDRLGTAFAAAVSISSTTEFVANGNILTRSGSTTYANLINLGAGTDNGVAVNNVCNGVTVGCVSNNTGSSNVIATPNVSGSH